jgi:hypothetical protein
MRSLICDTDSGGLSALTADISKQGYPLPQKLHKKEKTMRSIVFLPTFTQMTEKLK